MKISSAKVNALKFFWVSLSACLVAVSFTACKSESVDNGSSLIPSVAPSSSTVSIYYKDDATSKIVYDDIIVDDLETQLNSSSESDWVEDTKSQIILPSDNTDNSSVVLDDDSESVSASSKTLESEDKEHNSTDLNQDHFSSFNSDVSHSDNLAEDANPQLIIPTDKNDASSSKSEGTSSKDVTHHEDRPDNGSLPSNGSSSSKTQNISIASQNKDTFSKVDGEADYEQDATQESVSEQGSSYNSEIAASSQNSGNDLQSTTSKDNGDVSKPTASSANSVTGSASSKDNITNIESSDSQEDSSDSKPATSSNDASGNSQPSSSQDNSSLPQVSGVESNNSSEEITSKEETSSTTSYDKGYTKPY